MIRIEMTEGRPLRTTVASFTSSPARSSRASPACVVRCTARGCDWSVTSNVARRLGQFWRWHVADVHRKSL